MLPSWPRCAICCIDRLHLLLRLRQPVEGGLLRRHRAARIQLAEPILRAAHGLPGFADVLHDLRIELREELKERFQFFVQLFGPFFEHVLAVRQVAQVPLLGIGECLSRLVEQRFELGFYVVEAFFGALGATFLCRRAFFAELFARPTVALAVTGKIFVGELGDKILEQRIHRRVVQVG